MPQIKVGKSAARTVPPASASAEDVGFTEVSGRYIVEYVDTFDCWGIVDLASGEQICQFDVEEDCIFVCECLNYTNYDREEWREANEIAA